MKNSGADASSRHVALLTFPFSSHPATHLRLLRMIAAAAPNVTFSFFSTAKSNNTLFASPCPDNNIKRFDVHDGVPEGYVFAGKPQEDIELFLKVAAESCKAAVEKAEEEIGLPVSCVVADAFLWFTAVLAEEKGVPWVALWIAGGCSLFTHLHTDLIRDTVGINGLPGREDEELCFVPGTPKMRLGDLQGGIVSGNLASPFSVMLHKMSQILPKAAAVQINSFEELEPEINIDLRSKLKNVLNFYPVNPTSCTASSYRDDYECIPWLNKQETGSVAYIAFGTVATLPPHELVALAEALEESGSPFLWSLKESAMTFLPPGFVERTMEKGKVVPWAPQVQVLAHSSVGVYFAHCGWNSVSESIMAGVPIVSRPFFGDQKINTSMVESTWKIGVRIRGGSFTKSGTLDVLQQVLSNEKGKKLKERVGYYKELAIKAVEPNGSSNKNFDALVEIVTDCNH